MASDPTILSPRLPRRVVVIKAGPDAGETHPLNRATTIVGRSQDADIVLADPESSRRHLKIVLSQEEIAVEDLGSTNGTFHNGELISGLRILRSGDTLQIGQTVLAIESIESEPQPVYSSPASRPAAEKPGAPAYTTSLDEFGLVPARFVLSNAEEINQSLGHENLGFLSESHGVMPAQPPLLQLPPMYAAWDETCANLSELFRKLEVRQALDALPVLSAEEDDLPDRYLLRASSLISMFAHAYFRIETEPPSNLVLPDSLQRPWEQITRRLNRPAPHLSYIDLIVYNWKLIDPTLPDPMRVENMQLLVPTVDNKEERIFYLTQVEALAQSTPLISAVVRAQEAVHRRDNTALERELILITDGLRHITHVSFMKINPNKHSDSHVDPVIWAKTVAPFAVPINPGVAGPSGTSAPIFHVLDSFFQRRSYQSRFGAEMQHLRDWYPKHWQEFIDALTLISVGDYVEEQGSGTLKGLFKEATQAYIGESGFLQRHRLKVQGYLDIGFKVGRNITITGFAGLFKDRTWETIDAELEDARTERFAGLPRANHYAAVKAINTVSAEGEKWVKQIVLDVEGTGIRYQAGDRCGILYENGDELVNNTLRALRARGNEPIRLNAEWRAAINYRAGYQGAETLPLRTLLTYGRIRPVDRTTAKLLYAASYNASLRRIIEARAEDQWELWDLIELAAAAGFDPKRLWRAHPGEKESITRIVPPGEFRMYSISSAMTSDQAIGASELHLTIGRMAYKTRETEVSREAGRLGAASNFLGDTTAVPLDMMGKVSLKTVQPPRFSLPADNHTPIVMIAGGTGLSPFRSFIHSRGQDSGSGENWLFFGTRTKEDFYYREELEQYAAKGRLQVRVAFSREKLYVNFVPSPGGGAFEFEPGSQQYIGDEMLRGENPAVLWDLIRGKDAGGKGAYFYVCGKTGFANTVLDALKEVIRRNVDGEADQKQKTVEDILYRLAGEGRYLQEIFTTYTGPLIDQKNLYDASEIVEHNEVENGLWTIIDGRVYDVTEFAHLHPGGYKIISSYAGIDATPAYQNVLHHVNSEVDSMLGMYEIGAVRRLDFGVAWGVAIGPAGLRYISLARGYRTWVRYLYTVVEMENALRNDFSLKDQVLTRSDAVSPPSPLKFQLLIEVHTRFLVNYLAGTMEEYLENLWAVSTGLFNPAENIRWMPDSIASLRQSEAAREVEQLDRTLLGWLAEIAAAGQEASEASIAKLAAHCELLEAEDLRFMGELKSVLRLGIRVFEELEQETIQLGSDRLIEIARKIPAVLESYYASVVSGVRSLA